MQLVSGMSEDAQGIFVSPLIATEQAQEIELRRSVANQSTNDVMGEVAVHHSIEVMDREVRRFLAGIPHGGKILDVGGCWGWHWRNIGAVRPDVEVVIVDLVRENLLKAKSFLGPLVGSKITLVCGDGTCLPFADSSFDGYWSVQTLQHVERFATAISEASRVLKPGGFFASYSLNFQPPIAALMKILGRPYHVKGSVAGMYYLERGSAAQRDVVSHAFEAPAQMRYSEVFFKPELNFHGPGQEKSWWGKVDCMLSGDSLISRMFARQVSYHCQKVRSLK